MNQNQPQYVAFFCAYAPIQLIHAAGFIPYRILPVGPAPDAAGAIIHDNMCPHVKRVLDRALAGDLPDLAGTVVVNSCDAMRRLNDAWQNARPNDRVLLLDLPVTRSDTSVAYYAGELRRACAELSRWAGRAVTAEQLANSSSLYRVLANELRDVGERVSRGTVPGGWAWLQEIHNRSVTGPVEATLETLGTLESAGRDPSFDRDGVPIYVFGNVLPDPEAWEFFASCGARAVANDVCTGSRQIVECDLDGSEDVFTTIARGLLGRPACARTIDVHETLAQQVVVDAKQSGAHGVIAHVMKFCDPYVARMPSVREALRTADLPLLILEGDCTLRALGQHRTRVEAFVETLAGMPS
jgi:benzoyl-CoA reductase/2-hydroxyglutaryl-CoA dehydratase subunit BcrC/BadD/HgdB